MSLVEVINSSPEKAKEFKQLNDKINEAKADIQGIAVCGSHPLTINYAPFDDPKWLIYACSPDNLNPFVQDERTAFLDDRFSSFRGKRFLHGGKRLDGGLYRVNEWFEVHPVVNHPTRPTFYTWALQSLPCIWMRDQMAMPFFKGACLYPVEEMEKRFNPWHLRTSSIAWMLAKALVDCEKMSIPVIRMCGIMQMNDTEYANQRPGIWRFWEAAERMKIKVEAPAETNLFDLPKEVY